MDEKNVASTMHPSGSVLRDRALSDTPRWIAGVLDSPAFSIFARLVLTFGFWLSAAQKLFDFPGGIAEMQMFKLHPPGVYVIATLVVQVVGVGLILWGRYVWLGAAALAVFPALTIPIAHRFWEMSPPQSIDEGHAAIANIGLVGGLMVVAMWRYERARRQGHG